MRDEDDGRASLDRWWSRLFSSWCFLDRWLVVGDGGETLRLLEDEEGPTGDSRTRDDLCFLLWTFAEDDELVSFGAPEDRAL